MVGLDGAGKTTFTHTVQGVFDEPDATVGFIPSETERNGTVLKFWDLGGGKRIRGIWGDYVGEVHAAIWVVDASDAERFEETKTELHAFVQHNDFYGKPLLIMLNKMDERSCKPAEEMERKLELPKLRSRCEYNATPCVCKVAAADGEVDSRIWQGVDWLIGQVSSDYDELNKRIQTFKDTPKQKAKPEEKKEEKNETSADEVPMCVCCLKQPAVTRCSQSKWEAVCEECVDVLRKPADQGGKDFRELKRFHQEGPSGTASDAQLSPGLPVALAKTTDNPGLIQAEETKPVGSKADTAPRNELTSSEGQGLNQS
jgi:ADP-ribosylation factor-like protein 13B